MATNILAIIGKGIERLLEKTFDTATETFDIHAAFQRLQQSDPTITKIELIHDPAEHYGLPRTSITYIEGLGTCRIYRE
ncbi:MAG: hypothetical protein Q7R96_03675 [Nanoarchaeota archaeon]|nr:hypothetical protein [Nanoarchaeota archaeon]